MIGAGARTPPRQPDPVRPRQRRTRSCSPSDRPYVRNGTATARDRHASRAAGFGATQARLGRRRVRPPHHRPSRPSRWNDTTDRLHRADRHRRRGAGGHCGSPRAERAADQRQRHHPPGADRLDAEQLRGQPARSSRSARASSTRPIQAGAPGGASRPRRSSATTLVVVWPGAQTQRNPRGEYTENLDRAPPSLQGVGPGGFRGRRHLRARLDHRRARLQPGQRPGHGLDRPAEQPHLLGRARRAGRAPSSPSSTTRPAASAPATGVPTHQRFHDHRWRAVGLPDQRRHLTGGTKHAVRRRRRARHPGRRHLRARQRAQPADHRQRDRAATAAPTAAASASARRTSATTATTGAGHRRATRSATTAAPTSPAASGSSPAATATRSTDNALCGNFSAEYGGALTAFGYHGQHRQRHPTAAPSAATGSGSTVLRRGRRRHGRRRAAGRPDQPARGQRSGDHRRTTSIAGQPRQRRRRRDPAAAGERLAHHAGPTRRPINDHQQHDRRTTSRPTRVAASPSTTRSSSTSSTTPIAKNITTATAVTSDGQPAPAGLSTAANSDPAAGPAASTPVHRAAATCEHLFSKPELFDDVFYDNRAGSWDGCGRTASAARCPTVRRTASTTGTWAPPTCPGPLLLADQLGPADDAGHARPVAAPTR